MAMDYGDSAAPDPAGRMGTYAIQAATNAYNQARSVGLSSTKMGIIPMIGMNDVMSEVRGGCRAFLEKHVFILWIWGVSPYGMLVKCSQLERNLSFYGTGSCSPALALSSVMSQLRLLLIMVCLWLCPALLPCSLSYNALHDSTQ